MQFEKIALGICALLMLICRADIQNTEICQANEGNRQIVQADCCKKAIKTIFVCTHFRVCVMINSK